MAAVKIPPAIPPKSPQRDPGHPGLVALALFLGLLRLGTWQVERLAWKRDLISKVDARAHAAPVPAAAANGRPDPGQRRVPARVGVRQLPVRQADAGAGRHGTGQRLLGHDPLRLDSGDIVLVNRGFVLPEWRKTQAALTPPAPATASVTGLLRMGESGKGFLRNNDPAANLWYGRDLPAIAAARPGPGRALLHRRRFGRRSARSQDRAGGRADGAQLPQQSPGLCHHLVRAGADAAGGRGPGRARSGGRASGADPRLFPRTPQGQ